MTSAIIAAGFNGVQFDVVDRNEQPWLRGSQIATALGYSQPARVVELYDRHSDEFTDSMTAIVTLPTAGGPQETRIFSLRGCHLLAMFARTKVAKEFRVWVLDVLEKLNRPQPRALTETTITPDQQRTLHNIIDTKLATIPKTERHSGIYAAIWGRFKNHFRLAKYDQLPQSRMAEAISYLMNFEIVSIGLQAKNPSPKINTMENQIEEQFLGIKGHAEGMKEHQRNILNFLRSVATPILANPDDHRAVLVQMFETARHQWNSIDDSLAALETHSKAMCRMIRHL